MTPILVDANDAGFLFKICERAFHGLRKRDDFPKDAEVRLGPRAVRFRVEVLVRYAAELAAKTATQNVAQNEPAQLKRARQTRRQIPSA